MPDEDAPLRVAVSGAAGRVGREIVAALDADPGFACVAAAGRGDDLGAMLVAEQVRCLVDFSVPEAGLGNALIAVEAGVCPVVGTTGIGEEGMARIAAACAERGVGGCVVANFAVGAVVLEWLCTLAAPYFESCEIVEAHHPAKVDAPSGTAMRTAQGMLDARRGRPFSHAGAAVIALAGARGGELGGAAVHSLRLEGVVAEQEVSFGAVGQTLSLQHRTMSRAAFAPGVLLACRAVSERGGFFRGLGELIGLGGVGGGG